MTMKRLLAAVLSIVLLSFTMCVAVSAEELPGGWEYKQDGWTQEEKAEAKAAFHKAMDDIVGVDYEVTAFVGRQVAAGTNYCFLCKATGVYPDNKTENVLVYVYEDLDGNAEVTDITDGVEMNATSKLKLRKGPGSRYGFVKTIKAGKAVRVYSVKGKWAIVECGKVNGWMKKSNLR